jgi:hypothetical protein
MDELGHVLAMCIKGFIWFIVVFYGLGLLLLMTR